MNTQRTAFDARELRNVFGSFGTGVTVVTSGQAASRRVGVTANSFSSVSLSPPIVSWSLLAASPSLDVFDRAGRFVINILSVDQLHLSKRFASSVADKFEGVAFTPGLEGLPVLQDCVATIECRTTERLLVGDHVLFLGQVENYTYQRKPSLLFCQGAYVQGAECSTA
ncbi:MAG: flavin reductase family protein [Hylemonella sp.]